MRRVIPPLPDRLQRWADTVGLFDTEAAREIRELAEELRKPEGMLFRKRVLRQAARVHFHFHPRAAQARAIAAAWAQLDDGEYEVGSLQEMLGRLRTAGFPPLSPRRIHDLLDPDLD